MSATFRTGPRPPIQRFAQDAGVHHRLAPLQARGVRGWHVEVARGDLAGPDLTVAQLGDQGHSGGRDLVEPSRSVHDPGTLRPEQLVRARQRLAALGGEDPVHREQRAGRVGQGPSTLKIVRKPELAARATNRLGGRVVEGREQERQMRLGQTPRRELGRR